MPSRPRIFKDPVVRDRVVTTVMAIVVGGLLIAGLIILPGCQAHTKLTPATSAAERTTSDDRGYTEWEVIVEPKAVTP